MALTKKLTIRLKDGVDVTDVIARVTEALAPYLDDGTSEPTPKQETIVPTQSEIDTVLSEPVICDGCKGTMPMRDLANHVDTVHGI
jgi:hypothetical protein